MNEYSCGCGKSVVQIGGEPLLRFICHCTLCQAFNQAPEADMLIYRRASVALGEGTDLDYQRLRKPPAVDRGTCSHCSQPFAEFMTLPLLSGIALLPAALLANSAELPAPAMRVFYDRRVADAQDDLPRHSGYLASQLAFVGKLLPALLR